MRRDFRQYVCRRRRIVEPCVLDRSAGEDAGVVGPAEDDADAALLAQRQEGFQRFLFEQRVASCQQEAIEVAGLGERLTGLPFVESATDGLDETLLAQRQNRFVSSRHRFLEHIGKPVALVAMIDVVDEEDVDAVGAEAIEAVLERTHRAVVAVVVEAREGSDVAEQTGIGWFAEGRAQTPAYLG